MVLHKRRFPFRSWVLVNILAVIRATRDGNLCFQIVNFISCKEGTNTSLCSQRHASWMPYRVKVRINPGGRALIGKLAVAKLVKKCPACIEVKDVYNSLLLLLILCYESSIHFHILFYTYTLIEISYIWPDFPSVRYVHPSRLKFYISRMTGYRLHDRCLIPGRGRYSRFTSTGGPCYRLSSLNWIKAAEM